MFPKENRLDKTEIPNIVKRGKRIAKDGYTIRTWFDNAIEHPQFAVIVPKKVDNRATHRNYIKRRIRHTIQLLLNENKVPKAKYVIVVHKDFFEEGKEFTL